MVESKVNCVRTEPVLIHARQNLTLVRPRPPCFRVHLDSIERSLFGTKNIEISKIGDFRDVAAALSPQHFPLARAGPRAAAAVDELGARQPLGQGIAGDVGLRIGHVGVPRLREVAADQRLVAVAPHTPRGDRAS